MTFWFIFIRPQNFENVYHNIFPFLISLWVSLYVPNLQTSVLCLTSNVSEKKTELFYCTRILLYKDGLCVIGLLLVHPSGVDTNATLKISFYWCWYTYLPAVLYNFLIFPDMYFHTKDCYLMIVQPQWKTCVCSVVMTATTP